MIGKFQPQGGIYEPSSDTPLNWSDMQSVFFFRELLWTEATVLGIGKNLINVPSAITVADGG
uniref:Uncharacterized protein n=1 Tax=Candidatus Methanophagaceae archaeon ANME-1 ERB6 TaxID=2759912 RepID=A0A7G9YVX4_9EURY|nr:hypothetical protein MDNCFBIC_00028 [Methanosarcinales archaeon ANME-1 ERB6]